MTHFLNRISILLFLLILSLATQAQSEVDLDQILEDPWSGDLVYLDYTSEKETKIPVELTVKSAGKNKYEFSYEYPNEPKANSKSKVTIDIEGGKIAGDPIESIKTQDGLTIITATSKGKDNGKKAEFIRTYIFNELTFIIRKEVKYVGDTKTFMRNEYRLNR